jgi:membrane protease YdiL (CAAX protease family)
MPVTHGSAGSADSASTGRIPRWGLGAVAFVIAMWLVASIIAAGFAGQIWGMNFDTAPGAILVVLLGQSAGGVLAVWGVAMVRGSGSMRRDVGLNAQWADVLWVLVGVALQIVGALVLWPVTRYLGDQPPQQLVETVQSASVTMQLALALPIALIVPITEELIFRGIMLRAFMKKGSAGLAVSLSAAIFAAFHLLEPSAYPTAPLLLVVGLLAGWRAVRTGRLGQAIAIHCGFNLTVVLAALLT